MQRTKILLISASSTSQDPAVRRYKGSFMNLLGIYALCPSSAQSSAPPPHQQVSTSRVVTFRRACSDLGQLPCVQLYG
jgi:hypothetical protein